MVQFDRDHLRNAFRGENLPLTATILFFFTAAGILIWVAYGQHLIFNTFAAASSVVFFAATYLVLRQTVMKGAFERFARYVRRPVGAIIFVGYLALHYFLYGLFLERLLIGFYGDVPGGPPGGSPLYLSTGLVYPEFPVGGFFSILSNPSVTLYISSNYGITLIPFSFFLGFLIAVLVIANIEVVSDVSICPASRRRRAYVVLPSLGIAVGSSCCLSLPVLVTLVIPAAGALSYTTAASYLAFFAFPVATAVALMLNLEHSRAILRQVTPPIPGPTG